MSFSTNPMTIFRILTTMTLFGVTFFCNGAKSDIPTGYVKIGTEHAIPWRIPDKMTVVVKDAEGKTVVGATTEFVIHKTDSPTTETLEAVSDSMGVAMFDLKPQQGVKPAFMRIKIEAEGFVGLWKNWQTERRVKMTETVLPETVDAALIRAEPIAGIVVDEEGKPIEGVETEIRIPTHRKDGFSLSIRDIKRTTDAEGRWQFDEAPAGLDESAVELHLRHPEFISVYDWNGNKKDRPSFRKRTMRRGNSLSGRIVDDLGKPVAGARVDASTQEGKNAGFHGWGVRTQTDEDGKYRLAGLGTNTVSLGIDAPDKISKRIKLSPSTEIDTVLDDIALEPAFSAQFRFVDETGRPLPDISAGQRKSDFDGRLTVADIPKTGKPLRFFGPRKRVGRGTGVRFFQYRSEETGKTYLPDDEEQVVTMTLTEIVYTSEEREKLRRMIDEWDLPEKITFRVVDAQGNALREASVRILLAEDQLRSLSHPCHTIFMTTGKTDEKGVLVADFSDCDPDRAESLQMLITCPGYIQKEKSWFSDFIRGDTKRGGTISEEMTVTLTKATYVEFSGKVVRWDGTPIPGTAVGFAFEMKEDEKNDDWTPSAVGEGTTTDTEGRWSVSGGAPENITNVGFKFEHPDYKPRIYRLDDLRREYWYAVLWKE